MSFASRLREGERLLSAFIKTPSHAVIEIAGDTGLDAVVLDAEHAPFDAAALDISLLACRAARTGGLVRVPDKRPATLQQALDLGADGLVLPHIISADQANAVLQALYYRNGSRGFSNSPRAGGYGRASLPEHLLAEDGRHAVIWRLRLHPNGGLGFMPDPSSGEPALAVVQESGVGSRPTRWYSGDGPPPPTLEPAPAVGDFYLDRLTGQVYELSA